MPLFLDVRSSRRRVRIDEVAQPDSADVPATAEQDMRYLVDEQHGESLCLVDAPKVDATPDRSVVVEALQHLSPEYRQILIEAVMRRNTVQVIAARLGIPAGQVRVRLHYALHELRRGVEIGRLVQAGECSGPPVDRPRPAASRRSRPQHGWSR